MCPSCHRIVIEIFPSDLVLSGDVGEEDKLNLLGCGCGNTITSLVKVEGIEGETDYEIIAKFWEKYFKKDFRKKKD
jgi:hypothetical protein